MHDARGMDGVQTPRDEEPDVSAEHLGHASELLSQLVERLPDDELQRNEGLPVDLAGRQRSDDVGVLDPLSHVGFTQKALAGAFLRQQVRVDELQRDMRAVLGAGLVDGAHPAGAELADDLVGADGVADRSVDARDAPRVRGWGSQLLHPDEERQQSPDGDGQVRVAGGVLVAARILAGAQRLEELLRDLGEWIEVVVVDVAHAALRVVFSVAFT
jgi:hypothetical protein